MYQIHMRPKKGSGDMPVCSYGIACSRPDCIFRHPEGKKSKYQPPSDAPICAPFLLGECRFGDRCRNRHVTGEEAERIRERNAKTLCRFGSACTTHGCLFRHPPKEPCRYGLRCSNKNCTFAHPDPNTEVDVPEDVNKAFDKSLTLAPSGSGVVVFPKAESLVRRQEQKAAEANAYLVTIDSKKHPSIQVPVDAWIESWRRNPSQFLQFGDPYERLIAVNQGVPVGVVDLHYQLVDDVIDVFEALIHHKIPGFDWDFYDQDKKLLWITTGAGHHTLQKGRALIFDVLYDYLDRNGYTFKVAKDHLGSAGGFLLTLN